MGQGAAPGVWTYRHGMPDRSGQARYTHLLRWRYDPPETKKRGLQASGEMARERGGWIARRGDAEWWAARILELLSDGRARTWNAITVHLTGTTADVHLDEPSEAGPWLLCERGQVAWACEEGAVFWLAAEHVAWAEAA